MDFLFILFGLVFLLDSLLLFYLSNHIESISKELINLRKQLYRIGRDKK